MKPRSSFTSLAFYLPQFHEIPENNAWWGTGFTEWTKLRAAKTWSKQQIIRRPIAPLGEYNLTDAETLELQWDIASSHRLDGFAVWDYWFGDGRQLLETPLNIVLRDKLNFKYALSWANHSWYDKGNNRLLMEQKYLGLADYERYFERCSLHFASDNYVRIDGKPVFLIFDPMSIPDLESFLEHWQKLASDRGYPGIHFVGDRLTPESPLLQYFDKYSTSFNFMTRRNKLVMNFINEHLYRLAALDMGPRWFDFQKLIKDVIPSSATGKHAPTVMTGWDTTPRHGSRGIVYKRLDASAFKQQLEIARGHFSRFEDSHPLLLIKSWNEWAEGNIMEPDSVFGYQMLEAFRDFRASL